jgi:hypothetical protein
MSSIVLLASSAIETAFYSLYPKPIPKIIQSSFDIANAAGVLFFASKLNSKLPEAVIALSFVIGALAVDRFLPLALPKPSLDGALMASHPLSFQQKITKILHTTKLVSGLALVVFGKNPIIHAATTACSLYSLIKSSKINSTHSPYSWESKTTNTQSITIGAIYSLVKCAVFAGLRNHPSRTVSLFYAQYVFGFFDFVHILERIKNATSQTEVAFVKGKIVLAAIITIAASYFGICSLHNYFEPRRINLNAALKATSISAEALNSISVGWAHAPLMHRLIQTLCVSKIIGNLALACFSKEKLTLTLASLAEAFSLNSISSFKWINFTQTIDNPLAKFAQSGATFGKSIDTNSLSSITLSGVFRLYSQANSKIGEDLYRTISAIFDKSHWERMWRITYSNSPIFGQREISREMQYKVTLYCRNFLDLFLQKISLKGQNGSPYGYYRSIFEI